MKYKMHLKMFLLICLIFTAKIHVSLIKVVQKKKDDKQAFHAHVWLANRFVGDIYYLLKTILYRLE